MSFHADATAPTCASLPALVDEILRALTEVDRQLDTPAIPDAVQRLSEVHGALTIINEPGLAALVQLLNAQLLPSRDQGSVPADATRCAAQRLHSLMRHMLYKLLRGRGSVAADLLPIWRQLAGPEGAAGLHPSALVSLQFDIDAMPLLPPVPADGQALAESERALLSFLRAQEDAQRSEAAQQIAAAIAQACASAADVDERVRWLALRAYLIEFAQAGGDPVRARKIVAATARALRHVGQGGAALASLAREALFELAQRDRVTDDASDVARLFGLDSQFTASVDDPPTTCADDASASAFGEAVAEEIAAVGADSDRLRDAGRWRALADLAAGNVTSAPLADSLREIAAQLEAGDSARDDSLAAILLCLQSANDPAALADALREPEPTQRLQRLQAGSQAAGAHRLMLDLCATLRAEMVAAEQALDAADSMDGARAAAIATLARIAGVLQILALDAECDAVLALRARLEATDASIAGFDDAVALQWVQLQESFVLLPWRLHVLPAAVPAAADDAPPVMQATGNGDDSLHAIFIDEATRLLRELRGHVDPADHAAMMHAAHTLAGCSATVGAAGMAELAQALEGAIARGPAPDPDSLAETIEAFDMLLAEFAASRRCSDASELAWRWQQYAPVPEDRPEPLVAEPDRAVEIPLIVPAPENPLPVVDGQAAIDSDAELLAIFREEAADLLPHIEQAVRAWQQQPDDREQPAQLLRVLHTLKGSARMAGRHELGEEFHHAETDIAELAQQVPSAVATQLPGLLERVDRWLQSIAGTSQAPDRETPAPADAGIDIVPLPAPQDAPSPLLRVRADRLAQVADSSAEVWIGNARLREGLQEQRRAVADLSDDLARLRAQLRELEIEAESRILSHATQGSSADFDPLEFDRYTRLHELTRMMAESITDIAGVQRGLARQVEGLGSAASAQARELRRQQAELQALRSQPLQSVEARFRHLLRQASREAGCDASLLIEGAHVEIERGLLDRLTGPLEHLLRNAVVHGIEPPDERTRCGKPRAGRITLTAALAGNELRLTLADDGRGLDSVRIRERAVAVGLLRADEMPDARALAAIIFAPGFSTASEVTALSGRGIGMDAVRVELQALGGRIDLDSEPGRGCRFAIRLPASLASVQVILASAGRWRVALPAMLVQQVLQLDAARIRHSGEGARFDWQGAAIRLLCLGSALGDAAMPSDGARVPVVVLRDGECVLAVQLDAIAGQCEVIVKHPGAQLAQVPGLAGATLLGDGGIALIIDPFRLPAIAPVALPVVASRQARLILVVDDSLTVRRASQRLLERHGYAVVLARDGVEALEQLQQQRPSAVLLDIEMPRMDGFELLAALRDDARLQALPVVMITSRMAERHRERAMTLGATAYMGKPFDEEALLTLLARVCAPLAAVA